jgi:aromatic-L-amino-acid decarboxylase
VPHDLRGAADDGSVTRYLNELNERIATQVRLSGEAFLSNAFLDGRFMLRACIVNFRTTLKDVAVLPDLVTRIGRELDARLRPSELSAG